MSDIKKYRLITYNDFDGLVCGMLFKSLGMIDEIKFAHPNEIEDEKIAVTGRDIIANLPYSEKAHLVFEHHLNDTRNPGGKLPNHINDPNTPSAARVVYNYYGGKKAFPHISEELMEAVDIADQAKYNVYDILYPEKWALLNFLVDRRTGLDKFHNFKISNDDLILLLTDYCATHTIEDILALPDVKERVEAYFKFEPMFNNQLNRCSKIYDNVVVIDLRREEIIYPGNRFTIYTFFPKCNVSLHILPGINEQKITLSAGKSIFNRTSTVDLGVLMSEYGGGGHFYAAGCQANIDKADAIYQEIVEKINNASK